MRLRNLFMILLLCMTVGVFSACTGDDGEAGPQGPQGPQGEPGEPGEGAEEVASFYSFLKMWGSATGEVACGDPILRGEGPLPGPALTALTMPAEGATAGPLEIGHADNANVTATCGTAVFAGFTKDLDGDGDNDITSTGGQVVLVKTGRAVETGEAVRKPADDFGQATSTVETKKFVGGMVYAKVPNTGSDEGLDRRLLYSNCGVGTDPPDIVGSWKAVEVSSVTTTYSDPPTRTTTVADPVVSLLKVCLVLDSHPGTTKCYVSMRNETTMAMDKSIALYDGMNLDTVVATANLDDNDTGTSGAGYLFIAEDLGSTEDITHEAREICDFFGSE